MTLRMFTAMASLLLSGLAGLWMPAAAQQPPVPWTGEAPRPPAAQKGPAAAQPKAQPKAQAAPKAKEETVTPRSNEGQLRQRVEQLEEQLADMQVLIGTLESLGKGGSGSGSTARTGAGGSGAAGVDQARMDSLETQMRALASQVEQLTGELRQQGRRSEARPADPIPPTRQASAEPGRPGSPGFGSTTITSGAERGDPIGRMITEPPAAAAGPAASAALPSDVQSAASAKQLYETSYAYLLQQDYGAAEVSFEEFLRRYPSDRQTADAQYWYAETLYVQRRYKPAGQAFLKVIEKHQASAKVPNSILKLAMSLEQLGQKDCALFGELENRHPNAPADVKTKARALKQRVGC